SGADAAASTLWSDVGNWANSDPPVTNETNVALTFPAVTGPALNSTDDVAGLTGVTVHFTGSNYHFTGATSLTFAAGGIADDGGGNSFGIASMLPDSTSVAFASNGGQTTITGVLSGNGGLIKKGNGVLQLTASNTYTGGTKVSAGTLQVDGATGNVS